MNTCRIQFENEPEEGLYLDQNDIYLINEALGYASDVFYDLGNCSTLEDYEKIYDKSVQNAIDGTLRFLTSWDQLVKEEFKGIDECEKDCIEYEYAVSDRVFVSQNRNGDSAYSNYKYIYADDELVAIIPDSAYQNEILERIIFHAKAVVENE